MQGELFTLAKENLWKDIYISPSLDCYGRKPQ